MNSTGITVFLAAGVLLSVAASATAQPASRDEALSIARNLVTTVITTRGSWGGATSPSVLDVSDLKDGKRVVGYLCRIDPEGFVIVSLRRELTPVQAFAERGVFVDTEENPAARDIKRTMRGIIERLERAGATVQTLKTESVAAALSTNHVSSWNSLLSGQTIPLAEKLLPLTTKWHQNDPYNRMCPPGSSCARTLVGCVSTAASQIMRYWAWPPYGTSSPYNTYYDWGSMPDSLHSGSAAHEITATSELCYEVGRAAATNYGCDVSTAWLGNRIGADMTDAFKDVFRFHSNVDFELRWHHSDDGWWNIVKDQIDLGMPVQYGILGEDHSTVVDGWSWVGSMRMFHMNYGWGNTFIWRDMTNIEGAESLIRNIWPAPTMSTSVSGTYPVPSFPYRYFMHTTTGSSATFDGGHYLQFLPGVSIRCTSPGTGVIQFYGWSGTNTRMFTDGISSRGIRIHNGHLKLYSNGGVKFFKQ